MFESMKWLNLPKLGTTKFKSLKILVELMCKSLGFCFCNYEKNTYIRLVILLRFNKGHRLYWIFVKEFMSRNEIEYLKREWCITSTQQLSIAWLKDVLNKQTLLYHFQVNKCMLF